MLTVLWRLTRGYRLRPWRSPYLRWRIETYQGWHAEDIGFGRFCAFVWRERRSLARYAAWAAKMEREVQIPGRAAPGGGGVLLTPDS
jgi:hypothetical protein